MLYTGGARTNVCAGQSANSPSMCPGPQPCMSSRRTIRALFYIIPGCTTRTKATGVTHSPFERA